MGHFAQAATAKAEITIVPPRSAAYTAAIVQANSMKLAPCGQDSALVLLVDHGCLSHDVSFSPLIRSLLLAEGHTHCCEQRACFLVRTRCRNDGNIHTANGVDLLVVDFWKNQLFFDA
jgi:hypothetical protein